MNSSPANNTTNCLCERLGSNNYFYYSHDSEGSFTFVSSGVTRLLGYQKSEFLQHYTSFLTNAPCNDKVENYTAQALAGNTHSTYEIEIYKKDRSICWLEIDENPVFNAKQQVIAVEGIARDISEQKQYKNALKYSLDRNKHQDKLQAALDAAGAGTFSYDVIHNKIWWDEKSYALYSVNSDAYSNTYESWKNLIFAEDLVAVEKELNRALASKKTHFELSYRIQTESNQIRWINVKAQITRNKQFQALWIDGLHLNITKTKELENKLLESETRFRSLVESSPDWIWETDTRGFYTYTSPYIKDLLGYEPEEILGQTLFSLMTGDERIRLVPILKKHFIKQRSFSRIESINLHKNGQSVTLETNASPMFDIDRKFTGYRGIHRNITERIVAKQLQLEKEIAELANTSKSEFLANMSHELRTPMHAILSFSRFGIKKINTATPEKLLTYFEKINLSGERLLSLLNDLLDLSKLEAGKVQYKFSLFNLKAIIEQVVSEQDTLLEHKSMTLTVIKPDCKTDAQFDSIKIAQVISNFLSNAIKFSEQSSTIIIAITADELFSDLGSTPGLRLSVTDQGIGIPGDELEYIFDKFIQSSKTKTNAGGTGLGLAICKEFIDAHHGRIWAEHNPKGGAIINFVIPLEQPKNS